MARRCELWLGASIHERGCDFLVLLSRPVQVLLLYQLLTIKSLSPACASRSTEIESARMGTVSTGVMPATVTRTRAIP